MRLAPFLLLAISAAGGLTAVARGDEGVAGRVAALCQEALARAQAHDFAAARDLYAKALRLAPSPAILLNLALAELRSGHPVEALQHLRLYAEDPHAEPAKVELVKGTLLPKAQADTGHVSLEGVPKESFVWVDGQAVPAPADALLDVMPGRHVVTARSRDAGYVADVDAAPGTVVPAKFRVVFAGLANRWPPRSAVLADGGAAGSLPSGRIANDGGVEAGSAEGRR